VPGIEHITKYHGSWSFEDIIHYQERELKVDNAFYADSVFFRVFPFKTIYGNLATALDNPFSMVLTQSEAKKIFGAEYPLGKTVTLKTTGYGINDYMVTAVIEDVPNNCSFRFDAAFALSGLNAVESYNNDANNWGSNFYTAFVLMSENGDINNITTQSNKAFQANAPEWVRKDMNVSFNPLKGLQFRARYGDGVFQSANKSLVHLLGAVGLIILLIACFNYFNLTQAKMQEQKTVIGIKKTVGASNRNLSWQSILETTSLFIIALGFTLLTIKWILPYFNELTFSSYTMYDLFSSTNLIFILCFFLFSLVLFALFPAFLVNRQKVMSVVGKKREMQHGNRWFSNSLVTFQFIISIMLIISTLALNKQYRYMLNADYGYNRENIVYIPLSPESTQKKAFLEQEFERNVQTREVAFASGVFGSVGSSWGRDMHYQGKKMDVQFNMMAVDHDFFNLFDIDVIQGETFSQASSNRQDMIFNTSFIRKYQLDNPMEARINQGTERGYVIGVVSDFNYNSMRETVEPMGFLCDREWCDIMYVKFNSASLAEIKNTLSHFESIWNEVSPNFPFQYHFMDRHFEQVYQGERHIMKILSTASVLTLFIAGLGLFGLAYYATNKRIKEIGIRKVNGAKIREVITLLNSEFIVKVIIAFAIGCPLVYGLINVWLSNYAFHTQLSWWIFAAGGAFVLFIALLTVSFQSYYVASRNPIEALRYE
jgi:putative ABC transport system permease protein